MAKLLQRDGYTLKTQYRNLAIFSFFFFSLVATETNFFGIYRFLAKFLQTLEEMSMKLGPIVTGEPIPGYTLKTQYRNPAIFSLFFFFFSLVAIETNFCRIFFIFLFLFLARFRQERNRSLSYPHTDLSLVSRLSSSARGKGQGASAFARERERASGLCFLCLCARACVCVVA